MSQCSWDPARSVGSAGVWHTAYIQPAGSQLLLTPHNHTCADVSLQPVSSVRYHCDTTLLRPGTPTKCRLATEMQMV